MSDCFVETELSKVTLNKFVCVVMNDFIRCTILLYVGLEGDACLSSAFSWKYEGDACVNTKEEGKDIIFPWLILLIDYPPVNGDCPIRCDVFIGGRCRPT